MATEILTASMSDKPSIVSTITLAFSSDPMTRWTWPDAHQYLSIMPSFIDAFCGKAFQNDGAHCTIDRHAAALWLPPGIRPDDVAMAKLVESSASPAKIDEVYGLMEKMKPCQPEEPHWYLPMIGVDPTQQGKGYGSALLNYALQRCDRQGDLAYLESSNPKNIQLYERHGFRVTGEVQSGTSPTMKAMIRRPRG